MRARGEDVFSILSCETQKKIGDLSAVKIRAIGIRLTHAQDQLIHALFKLLHEKSENKNLKSKEFYGGNGEKQMIRYGGGDKIAESATIRIFPSELYKAYTDSNDYSGSDIKFIKNVLLNMERTRFLIIYERARKTKGSHGKNETRVDRIEEYQTLFKILNFFEGLTEEEVEKLDNGGESVREKRGELIISLNPLLTDQINSKYVEYPSDINKRTQIAAGGAKFVTESMIALRDYLLREISARRFHSEINEENLIPVLRLEEYLRAKRRKMIQKRIYDAIEFAKNLGIVEICEHVIGALGQRKHVFYLNREFQ